MSKAVELQNQMLFVILVNQNQPEISQRSFQKRYRRLAVGRRTEKTFTPRHSEKDLDKARGVCPVCRHTELVEGRSEVPVWFTSFLRRQNSGPSKTASSTQARACAHAAEPSPGSATRPNSKSSECNRRKSGSPARPRSRNSRTVRDPQP